MVIGPWGPLYLHKQSPAILGILGLLAGQENPCQSIVSKNNYRYIQKFNSGLGTIENLWHLRYRARIYSGKT